MTSLNDNPERPVSESENHFWYAIRTFNCQEKKVCQFLTEKGFTNFIPMTTALSKANEKETQKRILVPAIHNLLFVEKQGTQQQMLQTLKECPIPISIFRHPGVDAFHEIPARDMIEIRLLCDPSFNTSVFMSQSEADAMIGKEVKVMKGPFKGAVGRLVRRDKQYYFLKTIIGMGVMVRISRWYCEPL